VLKSMPAGSAMQRALALRAIAEARVKRGERDQAYSWSMAQPTQVEKAYALLGMAEGMLNLNRVPVAHT
jgi:hypothetical protein